MTGSSSEEKQVASSPARQMLEVLAQASREMTIKLDETAEEANKLNQVLEGKVSSILAAISRQSELVVSKQLATLSVEKDAILAELSELRRDELAALRELSNELKTAVSAKLDELVNGLKTDVKTHLDEFKSVLEEKESDVTQSVSLLRMAIRENLTEQLESIRDNAAQQERELAYHQSRHQKMLKEEVDVCLQKLIDHNLNLLTGIQDKGDDYLASFNQRYEQIVEQQNTELEQRIKESADIESKVKPLLQCNLDFTDSIASSFSETCKQVADLQVNLHENMARNLGSTYRMEVLSIARDTEDKISVVQSHMQSILTEFLNDYSEKSTKLLEDFQIKAKAAKPAQPIVEDANQDVSADLFLDKIKKEVRRTIEDSANTAKERMEQRLADIRSALNKSSQTTSDAVEDSFNECVKRVQRISDSYKEDLNELSRRVDALEQLMSDTRDLTDAISQSDFDL